MRGVLHRLRSLPRLKVLIGIALSALLVISAIAVSVPSSTAGYTARVTNRTNTAATAPYFKCKDAVLSEVGTSSYGFAYALDDATTNSNTGANDYAGHNNNGIYQGAFATSATTPMACPRDNGTAWVLDGKTSYMSTSTFQGAPSTFTIEIWFKTTAKGGRLIGFGDKQTGASNKKDRVLYINTAGQVVFGTYNGAVQNLTTAGNYADGQWHHAVGTLSPQTGMALYLDGQLSSSSSAFTASEAFNGYWKIGYDSLSGWPGAGNNYFTGSLRYAAAYENALTAKDVTEHYVAGK